MSTPERQIRDIIYHVVKVLFFYAKNYNIQRYELEREINLALNETFTEKGATQDERP